MADSMLASNLVAMFDPTYYANPRMLWYTPYVAFPPISVAVTGNTLTVQSTSSSWTGQAPILVTASNGAFAATQTFTLTVVAPPPPVLSPLANLTVTHNQNPLVVNLSATDASGRPVTFSAKILPQGGSTPPITATVAGSQLTLRAAPSFTGTYTAQVTATNGMSSTTTSFTVTVSDVVPQLAAIADQSMAAGQTSLRIPLTASDPDGDPLTLSAAALTPSALAYQLNHDYGFGVYNGSYYANMWGADEKWLTGTGGTWYALLPSGKLYRWTGDFAQTITAANLVASLDPIFYVNPQLLWNAQPPVPPNITAVVQGGVLTLTRPASLTGVFQISVTASDGVSSSVQTFGLTLG
jgi:hypothetical protein